MLLRLFPPPNSLARRTLGQVAIRIILIVAAASALSFWHVRTGFESEARDTLTLYAEQRRARESAVFEAADRSLELLRKQYLRDLQQRSPNTAQKFAGLFEKLPDGTWRARSAVFDGTSISGFIGKHVTVDDNLRRRLLAAYDLLTRLGPAADGVFPNSYVVFPENAMLMRWPGELWAQNSSEWEIFGKLALALGGSLGGRGVVVAGPSRLRTGDDLEWSELYFDYGINDWVVSAMAPVVVDGEHVASIGHDILLNELIQRVTSSGMPGAVGALVGSDGRLLAHPEYMEVIQARGGAIPIADADNPELTRLLAVADRAEGGGQVLELADSGDLIVATGISGPDWRLVTVYPSTLIKDEALQLAWFILAFGFAALVLELAVLSSALKRQVSMPLRQFGHAADRAASGDMNARLDDDQPAELRSLAVSFNTMMTELKARENAVNEHNRQLESLNQTLRSELQKRTQAERELKQHRELNALLDTIDYGVLFLDGDLNSRLANRAYREMWRCPPDYYDRPRNLREDMEESWRAGLYAVEIDEWPGYLRSRIDAVRSGTLAPIEIRFTDGTVLQYECVALPDGGRMLTYFDITKLKRAEENLRIHLTGMDAAMDGMALLEGEGNYIYVNSAHASIYGFDEPAEMIGRSWREMYTDDELGRFDETIMPKLMRHGRWRGEATGTRHDGSPFPQEISLALTEDGGLICVVRDITERREREKDLNRAVRHAEESNLAKSRFLANMSHELRTPMNAIIGFTRLVKRRTAGQIPERQTENLGKILGSAEHLMRLIDEVLDISKIEVGQTDLKLAPYSPAVVVEDSLRTVEPIVRSGVRLVNRISQSLPEVVGDAAKFRQIMMNLLSNAAKFTPSGSITVTAQLSGGTLLVEVSDTGVGIAEDAHERIFEEFGQDHRHAEFSSDGTGLGLTISRRLARIMGGDLTVRSAEGQGATFVLRLPTTIAVSREEAGDSEMRSRG